MLISDKQWFDFIREQYISEAAQSSYAAGEMKAFDKMAVFSFYDGVVNPLWLMSHAERGALYLLMN